MASPRLSGGNLARAERCPASATLPRVGTHSDASERGKLLHAEKEYEQPEGAEIAFSLNVLTGEARQFPRDVDRSNLPRAEGEIVGILDRITVEADRVIVRDYKSGFGFGVAAPAENLQLAFYAVAAARVHGKQAARVEIEYLDKDGKVVGADLDVLDLLAAFARIRAIYDAAARPDPSVVTGDHCHGCPCITRCPAHLTMAIAFTEGAWPGVMPTDGLTPERVAQGWEFLKNAKRVLGLVEKTYRAIASQTPIELGGGRVLGQREVSRETLDGPITFQTLRDLHGEAVARAAVSMETSKTALEEALKPVAGKGKRAGMVRDALTEIGARNGVVVSRQVRVEEFSKEE